MTRLPQPGGDSGQWGAILNDFLGEAHNADGTLKHTGILAEKYSKPSAGIPKSDLDNSIQHTLDGASQLISKQDTFALLDSSGKIIVSQLPPLAIKETFSVSSEADMLALAAQRGDLAIRSDNDKTYVLAGDIPSSAIDWKEITTSVPAEIQSTLDSINARLSTMTVVVHYQGGSWPSRPANVGTVIWVSTQDRGVPPEAQQGDIIEVYSAPSIETGILLSSFTFEDQAESSSLSVSTPWTTTGGMTEFIATSAAKVHGSLGGSINNASSYRQLSYNETSNTNTRVLDMYFIARSVPSLSYVMSISETTTTRADVRINANRTITLRNGSNAVATSATVIDLNVTYRLSWKTTTSSQELRIYNQYGALLETVTGVITNNQHDRLSFGMIALSSGFSGDFDTLRIGDDWLEPYV